MILARPSRFGHGGLYTDLLWAMRWEFTVESESEGHAPNLTIHVSHRSGTQEARWYKNVHQCIKNLTTHLWVLYVLCIHQIQLHCIIRMVRTNGFNVHSRQPINCLCCGRSRSLLSSLLCFYSQRSTPIKSWIKRDANCGLHLSWWIWRWSLPRRLVVMRDHWVQLRCWHGSETADEWRS